MLSLPLSAQEKLPIDSAVRIGHLDNGLTYYIRHNEQPKQRAEFHIVQAVGATLEEDDQNGLAHFLEHMCFNGTEHFEGKGIINYFESVGVNFGGNINAYTSLDRTVYRLSDVPTIREGIIDSALLVMHDWSCAVSLLPEEIDAERGVIREEWRTGNTAARRMWKRSNELMYPGSKYAVRDVIGDTAVINNFAPEALRAYYHKWYGPDLQAIIVVGDIDVDAIENKIKALWANVPARPNYGERPWAEVADNEEPIVAIVQDKEARSSNITVLWKHNPIPDELKGTYVAYIRDLLNSVIRHITSERFSEISMNPNAPITGGYIGYYNLFPTKDAWYASVGAKEGKEKEAFDLLLTELEKIRRYGFSEDEIKRATTEILSAYESAYNERNNNRNINFVQEYIGNFLDGDAIPGIEWEYNTLQQLLPALDAATLNSLTAVYILDKNCIVNIQAPLKDEVQLPSKSDILAAISGMPSLEIEAPVAEKKDLTLIKKQPKAGKIKKISSNEDLGITEYLLKNGIRIIFKPTDFQQDEILFTAFSEGGLSMVNNTQDLPSAYIADNIISMSGIGDLSLNDLRKALTGKQVGVNVSINYYSETMSGSSTIKDFETMLQLIWLYFTSPRQDEEAYQTLMDRYKNNLINRNNNPKAIFSDSVTAMTNNYSERIVYFNTDMLDQVSQEKAYTIYRQRFANPADFVFTFTGNIDPYDKQTQKAICNYIGSLKTQRTREKYIDRGIRAPKGIAKNYFDYPMETSNASNRIQFTSYNIPWTLQNYLNMEMIGRILSTRYLESIREREGGSYGVGCYGTVARIPVDYAVLIMQFDTDPAKQQRLMEIIYEEIDTILKDGPLASDLLKEKESMLKDFDENIEKNESWDDNYLPMYYRYGINYPMLYKKAVNDISAQTVKQTLQQLMDAGNNFEVVMMPK